MKLTFFGFAMLASVSAVSIKAHHVLEVETTNIGPIEVPLQTAFRPIRKTAGRPVRNCGDAKNDEDKIYRETTMLEEASRAGGSALLQGSAIVLKAFTGQNGYDCFLSLNEDILDKAEADFKARLLEVQADQTLQLGATPLQHALRDRKILDIAKSMTSQLSSTGFKRSMERQKEKFSPEVKLIGLGSTLTRKLLGFAESVGRHLLGSWTVNTGDFTMSDGTTTVDISKYVGELAKVWDNPKALELFVKELCDELDISCDSWAMKSR